jgi:hypothetical protein
MAHKAFLLTLLTLALAMASGPTSAQVRQVEFGSAMSSQQTPVYLKHSLTSARDKEREEREDADLEIPVDETISRVGQAFHQGDADALESCLATDKRRIYLALDIDDQKQGHYGPGQVQHIFARLFRTIETRSFVYDSREIERQSGGAVFRADWTYLVLDTDEVVTERLQFKLDKGADDWQIYEIRAATR